MPPSASSVVVRAALFFAALLGWGLAIALSADVAGRAWSRRFPVAMPHFMRWVLKPDGRLVVSEILLDPDFISLGALRQKAHDAGFVFSGAEGPRFAYSAVFQLAVPA
jgi:hypothetical protein